MANLTVSPTALITEFLSAKGKEVIKRMLLDFESADLVRKFDGVYDTLTLADLEVVKDIIYEYTGTTDFTRTDDAVSVTGITLSTALVKAELRAEVNAQKERAYKAYLRGAGMNMDDLHFVEHLISADEEKMKEEIETAMWQAVEDTTPANIGTRKLIARFNGFKKLAKAAGAAGNGTVVATGAIDNTNAVAKVHQLYKQAHAKMKRKGFIILCNYTTFENYQENYMSTHGGREKPLLDVIGTGYSFKGMPLTLGNGKTYLVPLAGWGDDSGLIGTRPEWLAYGYDYEGEMGEWDVQKNGWHHWMLNKFPIGVQILLKKPKFLLVNDQLPN